MKLFTTIIFSLSLTFLLAQGHQPVFPNLDGQDLEEAVIDNFTPSNVLSYGQARDILFGTIDKRNDSLYCVYTDWAVYLPPGADPTEAAFQNGQGINTEHSWPQAFGAGQEPARADMHHLFPTRVNVNADRGNLPFGEISDSQTDRWYYLSTVQTNAPSSNRNAYSEYRENSAFEPREAMKGNIARALMYFYTIYRDEANAQGGNFFDQQRATLCQWHDQDPVDEREWDRTFGIAQYQDQKANPFVLDCTLAARMYCPELAGSTNCIVSTTAPDALSLPTRAFPNPNNGRTTLEVTTPVSGLLNLDCYDALGRQVANYQYDVAPGAVRLELTLPYAGVWRCVLRQTVGQQLYQEQVTVVVIE